MAIYVHRCLKCGEQQEAMYGMMEEPEVVCEKCGGETKRIMSASSFSLKGGGWAADGYTM